MTEANAAPSNAPYILGHSERELLRLERQAELFGTMTRDILLKAGLTSGMRVLDIGCGVGDVSLIAAEIVGPSGSVTGVDTSDSALSVARARAQRIGYDINFVRQALEDIQDQPPVDAVIGRFILLHMSEPGEIIRRLAAKLTSGTLLNFIEFDISTSCAVPHLPLLHQSIGRIVEVYQRSGKTADMGTALYPAFRAAGQTPDMMALTRMSNGQDSDGFGFIVESVRSLLPAMEALGIATSDEIDLETLHERLISEAQRDGDPCIFYPRLVGAWSKIA